MIKKVTRSPFFWVLTLVILGSFALIDIATPGVFVGHDTKDHVVRIAHFYTSLAEGNLVPRWSSNLNWGYGHPVMMFLYPLPSYVAAVFIFLGASYEAATEMVFALGFVGSGIAMWAWVRLWEWEKKNMLLVRELAGFAAAVVYMYAPYRFVDLYVRGAIGENFFFIWPPLVAASLLQLSRTRSVWYMISGALALGAMLLSHNALSIMYVPFLALYAVFTEFISYTKSKTKGLFFTVASSAGVWILGFGIASFFLIPAFFEGKYTLRDIVTEDVTISRFETLGRILYSSWRYGGHGELSVQIGIVQWLVMLGSLAYLVRIRSRMGGAIKKRSQALHGYYLVCSSIVFFTVSLFLMLTVSRPLYDVFTILQKFQFPWRWLSLAIFSPAVIVGVFIYKVAQKYRVEAIVSIVLASLVVTASYTKAYDHTTRPSSFYTGIYQGTTDTGESSPRWSVRFMENQPESHVEVIEGEAVVTELDRSSTVRTYNIVVESNGARIRENTLYFPGWSVSINGSRIREKDIQWQDPAHRGVITYRVPHGAHMVRIVFENTRLRTLADAISITSLLAIVGISSYSFLKRV